MNRNEIIKSFGGKFILGAAYFRIVPGRANWQADMRQMKDIGFDSVKIQVEWERVNPRKGEYYWEESDELMDVAGKAGLKVMFQIPLETVPFWAYREHDAGRIELDRTQTPIMTLLGGIMKWSACWDNPGLLTDAHDFVGRIVSRYKDHPALLSWDVCQEVEILDCACGHTAGLYREWLKKRFGDVTRLNDITGKRYASFDEIEPPYVNNRIIASAALDGQSVLLYSRFKSERLAERMGNLYRVAKDIDPRHMVIVHAHSDLYWYTWDDWLVARQCDFYGTSTHEVPIERLHDSRKGYAKFALHLDIMRSAAGEKQYYWISELSGGTGIMLPTPPKRINEQELFFNLWTSVAHGAKGIFFWQFKTEELVMQESPGGWGLVNLDGSETYRTEEFRKFTAEIRKNEELFVNLKSPAAEIGLLYLPEALTLQHTLKFPYYSEAFLGAYYALWIANVNFDLIRFSEDLGRYKTVYCPMPWIMDRKTAEAVRAFIRNGGRFVCDGGLAWYNEDGWLSRKVPGYGFAAEVGFEEKDIRYLDMVDIKTRNFSLKSAKEQRLIEINDRKKCKILGKFKDGTPAVISVKIGNGELVYLASCVSAYFSAKEDPTAAVRLVDFLGISPAVRIKPAGQVTCRMLEYDGKKVYFVFNHSEKKQEVETSIPGHGKLSLAGKEVKIIGLK